MKRLTKLTRALIFLPTLFLALHQTFPVSELFASPNSSGLTYTVYDNRTGQGNSYNSSPPIPPSTPIVETGSTPLINQNWGNGGIFSTGISEDVVVKFEGHIKPPTNETYYLCAASDDGFQLILDDIIVINDWYDRGGGCGQTADVDFSDGSSKQLTAWYYENGGGAFAQLLYYTGMGWEVVPSEWYSTSPTPTTTTSTTTTTLPPPADAVWGVANEGWNLELSAPEGFVFSSVLFASYGTPDGASGNWVLGQCHAGSSVEIVQGLAVGQSSVVIPSSNGIFGDPCGGTYKRLAVTLGYAPAPTTTTSTTTTTTTTTTSTTTTTTVPETTTTEPPETTIPPVEETTTVPTTEPEQPTTTTQPEETTTTSVVTNEPTTTVSKPEETTTTIGEEPDASTPETTIPEPAAEQEDEETPQVPEVIVAEFDSDASAEELAASVEELISSSSLETVIDDIVAAIADANLSQEQVQAILQEVLAEEVSNEVAVTLAVSEDVVQNLTAEQAAEVFGSIDEGQLTEELGAKIVAAVQDAPTEVREEFEDKINVFGGATDTYVPLGSTVSVGTRRAVIAAGAVLAAAPMAARKNG